MATARRLQDHVPPHVENFLVDAEEGRGHSARVAEVHGLAELGKSVFRRQDLREKVVTLGVVGPGKIEVATLERAGLLLEEEVVHHAEPLDLFVSGDARH